MNRIIYTDKDFTKVVNFVISEEHNVETFSKAINFYEENSLKLLSRSFPKNETYDEYSKEKLENLNSYWKDEKKVKEKEFNFREFETTLKPQDIRVIAFIKDKAFLFREKLPDDFISKVFND